MLWRAHRFTTANSYLVCVVFSCIAYSAHLPPSCHSGYQARKQHARAQKICDVALQQVSQYVSAWGEVFFQTHKLPSLKAEEAVVVVEEVEGDQSGGGNGDEPAASSSVSSEHRRALMIRLQGMWREVRSAQEEWRGQAQVRPRALSSSDSSM